VAKLDPTHLVWRKSSRSGTSNCVEVALHGALVLVRDSKDPLGPVLTFSKDEWDAFLAGVRRGEFHLPVSHLH
jgi:hypothetical protein